MGWVIVWDVKIWATGVRRVGTVGVCRNRVRAIRIRRMKGLVIRIGSAVHRTVWNSESLVRVVGLNGRLEIDGMIRSIWRWESICLRW